MAHDVKLDVYTVMVKMHGKDEYAEFKELRYVDDEGEEAEMSFVDFFNEYIKGFNGDFMVQESTGKAIHLSSENVKFSVKNRTITGIVDGGTTGIGSTIKTRKNAKKEAFRVQKDNVNSIPYYFKLWLPEDSNVGLFIIQGLGSRSINDVMRSHLRSIFAKETKGISLLINPYVPKGIEKEMRKEGVLSSIILKRFHLPSDKGEKILGLKYSQNEDVTIEVKISGLGGVQGIKRKLNSMLSGEINELVNTEPLEEVGMDGNHKTYVQFKHNGKTATAVLDNNFKLSPSFYLDENDYVRNIDNLPTYDSLDKYCVSFLAELKNEIGYKAVS